MCWTNAPAPALARHTCMHALPVQTFTIIRGAVALSSLGAIVRCAGQAPRILVHPAHTRQACNDLGQNVRAGSPEAAGAEVAAAPVRLVWLRPQVIGIASEAGGEGGVSAGLAATTAAARARRWHVRGGGARRQEALKGEEVQAGRRGDKCGRWAVEELLGVRRVRGRGRGLEVHVRWEGEDAAGTAERCGLG